MPNLSTLECFSPCARFSASSQVWALHSPLAEQPRHGVRPDSRRPADASLSLTTSLPSGAASGRFAHAAYGRLGGGRLTAKRTRTPWRGSPGAPGALASMLLVQREHPELLASDDAYTHLPRRTAAVGRGHDSQPISSLGGVRVQVVDRVRSSARTSLADTEPIFSLPTSWRCRGPLPGPPEPSRWVRRRHAGFAA